MSDCICISQLIMTVWLFVITCAIELGCSAYVVVFT
jgi:hypothetical protein